MARLIPAMEADVGRPVAPWLYAADAEGPNDQDHGGYGVVASYVGQELATQCLVAGCRPGRTVAKLDGSIAHLRRQDRELRATIGVSRVPREVLALPPESWTPVSWGRWRQPDHITLGEGRAVLGLLEKLASKVAARRHTVVVLEDNEPWASAAAKGRSPAFCLNRLLRRRLALQLASAISVLLPWVDTLHQPADWLSRLRCSVLASSPRSSEAK